MLWVIVIVSAIIFIILTEIFWIKMRQKGHKDLWDILSEKFSKKKDREK